MNVKVKLDVTIPMRDGVRLSGILFLPRPQAPSPAILSMTPYTAQSYHQDGMHFASHGYPFLVMDVRGRGNSHGEFHPLNVADDGHDLIEWLAGQSFCNGKVAMWGASYLGFCQWATARERPPHLAAMVPTAPGCFGIDIPLRNNVFSSYMVQWLAANSGRVLQSVLAWDWDYWRSELKEHRLSGGSHRALGELCGDRSGLLQEWLDHPEQDEYWDRHRPSPEQYAKISIPILTITGSHDGDQPGALEYYRQHMKYASVEARSRHYLIIGPWDHPGTVAPKREFGGLKVGEASLLDLRKLHRQWYAWTLQGGPKPEFLRKNVAYYVMGADEWRYADSLDAITAVSKPYYLESSADPTDIYHSGTLCSEHGAHGAPDQYVYDPRDVSLASVEATVDFGSLVDTRMQHAAVGRQLVYHTEPFESDTEVSGFFRLSLWLAIDQPDTDFRATIYEVALDGSVVQITADWLRARYRLGLREARLIDTQAPLRYDFARFTFVSRLIRKGSRLRLVVGPLDSLYHQKNYNSGRAVADESMQDARAVTVTLFHDRKHPSALYVPFADAAGAGAVNKQ